MGLARLQKNPIQRLHLEAIWHHTVASLSLPLLGRFEKAVAGQCVVRVYSVAHAEWLKRTVQASELDAAAAHEIARLVELERS